MPVTATAFPATRGSRTSRRVKAGMAWTCASTIFWRKISLICPSTKFSTARWRPFHKDNRDPGRLHGSTVVKSRPTAYACRSRGVRSGRFAMEESRRPGGTSRRRWRTPATTQARPPACCRAAVAIDPRRRNAHKNLGVALQGLGRYAEAARSYLRAADICPADTRALRLLQALIAPCPGASAGLAGDRRYWPSPSARIVPTTVTLWREQRTGYSHLDGGRIMSVIMTKSRSVPGTWFLGNESSRGSIDDAYLVTRMSDRSPSWLILQHALGGPTGRRLGPGAIRGALGHGGAW
jgi:hypothetical protein